MSFQQLKHILITRAAITETAWNDLSDLLEPIAIKKNVYLLEEGERAKYIYFLNSGIIRVFYNNDGNEYNKTFFVAGMFPTAITSLASGEPSKISFQALADSQLVRFSYQQFTALFKKHRCLESFLLKQLQQEWIKKERHDIEMVTNDATRNYLIFREKFPGLENQIAQYHVASYLGITPIQLSRIRAQLIQRN